MQAWEEKYYEREEAERNKLKELVVNNLRKGRSVEEIADFLEESVEKVRELSEEAAEEINGGNQ